MLEKGKKKVDCICFTVITVVSVGLYKNASVTVTGGGVRAKTHKVSLIWFP